MGRTKGKDIAKERRRIRKRGTESTKMAGTLARFNHGSGPSGRGSKNIRPETDEE